MLATGKGVAAFGVAVNNCGPGVLVGLIGWKKCKRRQPLAQSDGTLFGGGAPFVNVAGSKESIVIIVGCENQLSVEARVKKTVARS